MVRSVFIIVCLLSYFISIPCHANSKAERKIKNPKVAIIGSLCNTLIPTVGGIYLSQKNDRLGHMLTFYGITIGPSVGNFYARDYKRGYAGIGLRLISELIIFYSGVSKAISRLGDDTSYDPGIDQTEVIFSSIIIGSTIYNIVSGPKSVKEFNLRQNNVYLFPKINISKREVSLMACFSL